MAQLLASAAPAGVEVADQHAEHVVLAVQGPLSDEVLTAAGLPAGHPYMSFAEVDGRRAAGDRVPHRLHGRAWV